MRSYPMAFLKYFLIFAMCAAAPASHSVQNGNGTIEGIVVNEQQQPVVKALVNADPVDGKVRMTAVRYVETDERGRFAIQHLDRGTYRIYAMKEAEGYPNTRFSFYSNVPAPLVTLGP